MKKFYELKVWTRFSLSGQQGLYLKTDGMYAQVRWDDNLYSENYPFDLIAAYTEVEVIQ